MKNDFKGSSRSNYRAKRMKTNFVLNGLIGIVILLIVVVAFSIFSGNDKTSANKEVQTAAEKTQSAKQSAPKIKEDTKTTSEKTTTKNSSTKNNDSVKTNQDDETASSSSDNGKNSDQLQTVDSPDGSTTTTAPAASSGQHVTSYDSSSQDWQEMLQAMSSATGIDQGNMTVWFLGSDRSTPGGSVGTISAKDNKGQKYKVYLQWNGQGYTATRVEQAQ